MTSKVFPTAADPSRRTRTSTSATSPRAMRPTATSPYGEKAIDTPSCPLPSPPPAHRTICLALRGARKSKKSFGGYE